MKRKKIGIIVAVLVLVLAGSIGWNLRDLQQKRMLNGAESIAFTDVDGTERLLAQVDTTRLTESSQMLYNLLRALVNEERWYLNHADTASCLSSDAETWNFKREADNQEAETQAFLDDANFMRVFHYYEHVSLGGTSDDKDDLRRFGRICFVLTRQPSENILPLQEDHALAYRAYDRFADYLPHNSAVQLQLYLRYALEHYRQLPGQPHWLLTILNDYGRAVLNRSPFDLHHFGSLVRITDIAAKHCEERLPPIVFDSVYQGLDSLWALPHDDFSYMCATRGSLDLSNIT